MMYQYQAVNPQGATISGEIDAASEREAMRQLRQQELVPLEIAPASDAGQVKPGSWKKAASVKEKMLAVRELATLMKAGVPLAEAIASMAEAHGQSQIGRAFQHVGKALSGGSSLSKALQAADLALPAYLYQLVAAGELTGKLAQALQDAAAQMEYEERLAQEMRNALIYPAVLIVSGIAATLLVFIVVVPRFASMLKSSHADIPQLSLWVISAGLFVKQHLLWLGLGAAGLLMAGAVALGNPRVRMRLYESAAKLPLIGTWLRETETGRWAATLATMLENRVSLVAAMELAHAGVRLASLRGRLQQALREVRAGKKLADALAATRAINATGLNLVRVGERSGGLAPMLRALATLHENAGRDRMKRFLLLLEPTAILLIGTVIGTIMVAIMLAITSLSNIPL